MLKLSPIKFAMLGIGLFTTASYADSCINKLKPYFDNYQINLTYQSKKPQIYLLGTPLTADKDRCAVSYSQLQKYLQQTYLKSAPRLAILQIGWNFLALNKQVIYAPLKQLDPQQMQRDYADYVDNPKQNFEVSNQLKYQPLSIVNNRYGCYSYQQMTVATGAAHPAQGQGLACVLAGKNTIQLTFKDLFSEKQLVAKLVQNSYFSSTLSPTMTKPATISSFSQLQDAIDKANNDELSCYGGNLTMDDSSFALTRLNKDGSVDIKIGLNSDIGACSGMYREIELKNLTPIFKITQIIAAKDF